VNANERCTCVCDRSVIVCVTMRAMMLGLLLMTSCSPVADVALVGPGLAGRPDRERYVVLLTVVTPSPADVSSYQARVIEGPKAAHAWADEKRKGMLLTVPGFERALAAAQGSVVERWWMSGAVTIEVPKGSIASLQGAPGVRSIRADALIAP
jgi:hypothetical protein